MLSERMDRLALIIGLLMFLISLGILLSVYWIVIPISAISPEAGDVAGAILFWIMLPFWIMLFLGIFILLCAISHIKTGSYFAWMRKSS